MNQGIWSQEQEKEFIDKVMDAISDAINSCPVVATSHALEIMRILASGEAFKAVQIAALCNAVNRKVFIAI